MCFIDTDMLVYATGRGHSEGGRGWLCPRLVVADIKEGREFPLRERTEAQQSKVSCVGTIFQGDNASSRALTLVLSDRWTIDKMASKKGRLRSNYSNASIRVGA